MSAVIALLCAPLNALRKLFPTDPSVAGQSLASRNRRLLAAVGVIMVLMLLRYQNSTAPAAPDMHLPVSHRDECLKNRLATLQNIHGLGLISLQETGAPAVVGNQHAFAEVDLSKEIYVRSAGNQVSALPWPALHSLKHPADGVSVVDPNTGVIRQLHKLDSTRCQVVERHFYAHHQYKDLFVSQIALVGQPLDRDSPSVLKLSAVPSVLGNFRRVTSLNISDADDLDVMFGATGDGLTGVVVSTRLPELINDQVPVQTLTVYRVLEQAYDEDKALPDTILAAITDAAKTLRLYTPERLLKTHEIAWSADHTSSVRIEHYHSLNVMFALTSYFVKSIGSPEQPQLMGDRCFHGKAREHNKVEVFGPPPDVAGLGDYLARLVAYLEDHDCKCPNKSDPSASWLMDSLVRAVMGIQVVSSMSGIEIVPSWDLPSRARVELSELTFAEHKLKVVLTPQGILLERLDRLSEPLFTNDVHGRPVPVPRRPYHIPTGPAYVAVTEDGLSKMMKKLPPDYHQRPAHSSWPKWLVSLLVFLVIFFHAMLARLVYQEYCR